MERRYRLRAGQLGPIQSSTVSCGAACLALARMLGDPATARWVIEGVDASRRAPGRAGEGPTERFARLERHIHRRTNSVLTYPGRVQAPWPRSLGTSPWGARIELEQHAAQGLSRYGLLSVRHLPAARLAGVFDEVVARVRPGSPALLYVGSGLAPRHACLLFRDPVDGSVLLYEPLTGAVSVPSRESFAASHLGLGGWNRAWFVLAPGAEAPVAVRALRALVPRPAPGVVGPAVLRDSVPGLLRETVPRAPDACPR